MISPKYTEKISEQKAYDAVTRTKLQEVEHFAENMVSGRVFGWV